MKKYLGFSTIMKIILILGFVIVGIKSILDDDWQMAIFEFLMMISMIVFLWTDIVYIKDMSKIKEDIATKNWTLCKPKDEMDL